VIELAAQEIGKQVMESNLYKIAKGTPNLDTNVQNLDRSMAKDLAENKKLYDDDGKNYACGNHLKPNIDFKVNDFTFKTDDQGRIIVAEGDIVISNADSKRRMADMDSIGKGDQLPGDQRGHLIAHRFGASDGIENLVAMDGKLNQGDYKKLENTLADAVESGDKVTLKVEPVYEGDSYRPKEFRVTYSIAGDKESIVFKNESGD